MADREFYLVPLFFSYSLLRSLRFVSGVASAILLVNYWHLLQCSIENVTRHYRDHYLAALFRRDVEFIEKFSPGRLGQRFSEESSRIVEGLGPGLGVLVRSLSILFCGIIIGLTRVEMRLYIEDIGLVVNPSDIDCVSSNRLF